MYKAKCLLCNSRVVYNPNSGFKCQNLVCVGQQFEQQIASDNLTGTPLHYQIPYREEVDNRRKTPLTMLHKEMAKAAVAAEKRATAPVFVRPAEGVLPVSLRPPTQKAHRPYRHTLHIPYVASRRAQLMTPNVTINRRYIRELLPKAIQKKHQRIQLS